MPGKFLSTVDALSRAPASTISLIEENLACAVKNHGNLTLNASPVPASWSSGNAFVSGAGGLRFKSRAG